MYKYDSFDETFVAERSRQFRGQVARRLSGELSEEQFRPLRLMNGVYLQLHAYMLRIAIPYGLLSSTQLRRLAHIARRYDRGYGHITTRQNIQFNWPRLADIPDILDALAEVEMHAVQTSGNCIRNVTADPFAGVAPDEIEDPRVWSEIIRQWSTLHPEFSFLPRKFKIAVTGAPRDRAAIALHDIGLRLRRGADGEIGFEVLVGGGQGRTPMLAKTIRDYVPARDLLSYLEAILHVYNQFGRRDNKYKARIKILVHEIGIDKMRDDVEAAWADMRRDELELAPTIVERIRAHFAPPAYLSDLPHTTPEIELQAKSNEAFAGWLRHNVHDHKQPGYAAVTVSLKPTGGIPGDITAEQMEAVADLADRYGFGELRATHEQNLVFADIPRRDLHDLWRALVAQGLATPNAGLITDIIACPGLDYCALANARSIPLAQQLSDRFADLKRQEDIGDLKIKISGCINACGHHHVGHIGILGVDKKGQELYQITLGGSADENASIGEIVGPGVAPDKVPDAVETIVGVYLARRNAGESFLDAYRRLGAAPFKEALYDRD